MKLITTIESSPSCSYVATIGFFDGVHLGHRFLLQKLKEEALALGKESLVISFDEHPKTILSADYIPPLLTTNEEKIQLLEEIGIDACALLHFDKAMANLTAYEFLKQVIVNQLSVHTLLIGYDHRFGKNREEGFDEYVKYGKKLGLNILAVESYDLNNSHISSSVIRGLIQKGDVQQAQTFLSYPYKLEGTVINGQKMGRKLGFPTANLDICDKKKLIPGYGVYAVKVIVQEKIYWGMLNVGNRPTMNDGNKVSIEVNILNFNKDIYAEIITVLFLQKIREEMKFETLDLLIKQIEKDEKFVLDLANKNTH